MASSSEEMIDLTSDSEDEIQCTGSIVCSTTRKPPSNLKFRQLVRTPEKKLRQSDPMNKGAAGAVSKNTGTILFVEEGHEFASNNLMNSTWDAFGEPRQRNASPFRTPSPFAQVPVDGSRKSKTGEYRSDKHERKRCREGSLYMGSKRFHYLSRDRAEDETNWVEIEAGGQEAQYEEYRGSPSPGGREATADELDHSVIILDHDDKLDELIETSSTNWSRVSKKKGPPSLNPDYLLIDLDDHEDRLFEELEMQAPRQSPSLGRSGTIVVLRNLAITLPWVTQDSVLTDRGKFELGDVVELKSQAFLRISIIAKNLETGHIKLRGCLLERTKQFNGILPMKANELYWNIEIELDDPRPPVEQGMEEVDLDQALNVRETRLTNQIFPSCSFRETGGYFNLLDAKLNGPCVARWRYSCKFLTARDRWHNRWNERSVELLKEIDFSKDDRFALFVSDAKVRNRYRGNTILGGAYQGLAKPESSAPSTMTDIYITSDTPAVYIIDDGPELEQLRRSVSVVQLSNENQALSSSSNYTGGDVPDQRLRPRDPSLPHEAIDLSNSRLAIPPDEGFISPSRARASQSAARKQCVRIPGQTYTYGDCFCGAGGTTRGALMAGLKPIWGFDSNKHACSSWRLNFPGADLYQEWADEFIRRGMRNDSLKCDVLHLSPPCQYFSPAHTVSGRDDEMNMASLFACGMLLDVAKPRIATLEQTFGIVLLPRYKLYFNALVQMFTERGFSIRWKICHLQNWGLPQRRQRLIIIASCPGEVLPEFPPFTHVKPNKANGTLLPWVSVNSVINHIPRGAPDHDLELMEAKPLKCRPWSGTSIAPRCITTHGGQNYHPSGKRGFTNREFACLQGFPMNHRFSQINVKKQIGNAVPPCIAKVLFSWIKKALDKADGIEPEDEKSRSGNFLTEVIVLD